MTSAGQPYVLYFTMGLADVVIDELTEVVPGAVVVERDERFHVLELDRDHVATIGRSLRTADDLRLLLAGPRDVTDQQGFAALCAEAGRLARVALEEDPRDTAQQWSVTTSARRPVWRGDDAWDPAPIIAEHLNGADVEARERAPVDLRLQVDGHRMHLSMSLPAAGIRGREEARYDRKGALRQSVAAAVVRVALEGVDPAVRRRGVYDPFAGTGTLAAEAVRARLPVFASDVDPDAVELCRARLSQLGVDAERLRVAVFVHDIAHGLDARVGARVIVGNLPWGKQVKLKRSVELFHSVSAVAAVAVEQGGACAFLTTHEQQLVGRLRKRIRGDLHLRVVQLGLLGQRPAIVHVRRPT